MSLTAAFMELDDMLPPSKRSRGWIPRDPTIAPITGHASWRWLGWNPTTLFWEAMQDVILYNVLLAQQLRSVSKYFSTVTNRKSVKVKFDRPPSEREWDAMSYNSRKASFAMMPSNVQQIMYERKVEENKINEFNETYKLKNSAAKRSR